MQVLFFKNPILPLADVLDADLKSAKQLIRPNARAEFGDWR
jgi:hypothetical protein